MRLVGDAVEVLAQLDLHVVRAEDDEPVAAADGVDDPIEVPSQLHDPQALALGLGRGVVPVAVGGPGAVVEPGVDVQDLGALAIATDHDGPLAVDHHTCESDHSSVPPSVFPMRFGSPGRSPGRDTR